MAVSAAAVTAKLVALTLSDRNGRTVVFSVIAALVSAIGSTVIPKESKVPTIKRIPEFAINKF